MTTNTICNSQVEGFVLFIAIHECRYSHMTYQFQRICTWWCCGLYLEKILFWTIPGFSLSFIEEHTTLRPSMSMELHGTRNGGQCVTVPGPVSVCHTVTRLVTTDGRPSRHIMNKCKNSKTVNIIIRLGPPVQWLITKMLRMPTLMYTSTQYIHSVSMCLLYQIWQNLSRYFWISSI